MDVRVALLLATATILFLGAEATKVDITNNCPFTVWPATQTSGGGGPQLPNTGFVLPPAQSLIIEIPEPNWGYGKIWGRTGCSTDVATGKLTCLTGDCGTGQVECNGAGPTQPVTLVELNIDAPTGTDFFDIGLVGGFNLPVSIAPVEGDDKCHAVSCENSVNRVCPPELAVKNSNGHVVACKSACLAFDEAQYCCQGAYASAEKCPPTAYAKIFMAQCPHAHSYRYDIGADTVFCTTGRNYIVTFCP
ncbi:Thaumatin-like protein 1 [Linum grandiflorum]